MVGYNLTFDIPTNREVAERLRDMDDWVDMNPQYVATNIQPDHFPNRMLVGGVMSREYLQCGTNNRNTPYHFEETLATPSAGKLTLKKVVKGVSKVVKPVAKFGYNEIVKPVAKELAQEGVDLAKQMLRDAIKNALSGNSGTEVASGLPTGRKPRGAGRKPRGGNVYPSATSVRGNQKWAGAEGNIASVVGGLPVQMDLVDDTPRMRGRGRKPRGGSSGGGSGGKFNLKKALKKGAKGVGEWVKEDYTPFMVNKVAPVAKEVGVHLGRELLPLAFEAVGAEFGVPPIVSGVVGNVIAKQALSEKNTGVKGGKRGRPKKSKSCSPKNRSKGGNRGDIVKKVMKEKGLSLPQASKYVKEHGLY